MENEIALNIPFTEAEFRLLKAQVKLSGCGSPEEYLQAIIAREFARSEVEAEHKRRK